MTEQTTELISASDKLRQDLESIITPQVITALHNEASNNDSTSFLICTPQSTIPTQADLIFGSSGQGKSPLGRLYVAFTENACAFICTKFTPRSDTDNEEVLCAFAKTRDGKITKIGVIDGREQEVGNIIQAVLQTDNQGFLIRNSHTLHLGPSQVPANNTVIVDALPNLIQ